MSNVAEITRKEALEIINSGSTFSITYITCDVSRKTGGQRVTISNAMKCGQRHNMKANRTIGVRSADNSHHPTPVHIPLITHVNNKRVL